MSRSRYALDKDARKDLHQILLSAFPKRSDFELLTSVELNANLSSITAERNSLNEVVLELIQWAESQGRIDELLVAVAKARPQREDVKEFELRYTATHPRNSPQEQLPHSTTALSAITEVGPPSTCVLDQPLEPTTRNLSSTASTDSASVSKFTLVYASPAPQYCRVCGINLEFVHKKVPNTFQCPQCIRIVCKEHYSSSRLICTPCCELADYTTNQRQRRSVYVETLIDCMWWRFLRRFGAPVSNVPVEESKRITEEYTKKISQYSWLEIYFSAAENGSLFIVLVLMLVHVFMEGAPVRLTHWWTWIFIVPLTLVLCYIGAVFLEFGFVVVLIIALYLARPFLRLWARYG